MIKLYLASFLEPENFGPGRVIGIANGSKPKHIDVDLMFEYLIPSHELMMKYRKLSGGNNKSKEASKVFVSEYSKQLETFEKDVLRIAKDKGKEPIDVLPFKNGDTLASWERERYTNYRTLICPVLKRLGFDVILK